MQFLSFKKGSKLRDLYIKTFAGKFHTFAPFQRPKGTDSYTSQCFLSTTEKMKFPSLKLDSGCGITLLLCSSQQRKCGMVLWTIMREAVTCTKYYKLLSQKGFWICMCNLVELAFDTKSEDSMSLALQWWTISTRMPNEYLSVTL